MRSAGGRLTRTGRSLRRRPSGCPWPTGRTQPLEAGVDPRHHHVPPSSQLLRAAQTASQSASLPTHGRRRDIDEGVRTISVALHGEVEVQGGRNEEPVRYIGDDARRPKRWPPLLLCCRLRQTTFAIFSCLGRSLCPECIWERRLKGAFYGPLLLEMSFGPQGRNRRMRLSPRRRRSALTLGRDFRPY